MIYKTYTELEEMGIISTYKDGKTLYAVTMGGKVWTYHPYSKVFSYLYTL